MKPRTRDLILKSAHALFYRRGLSAVSLADIAEHAGVTKKTIYYHFDSKDDLIANYVSSRDQPNLEFYETCFERAAGTAAERTRAIFLEIGRQAKSPRWKGCGFLRASAELIDTPGHPALKAGARHKRHLEVWLAKVLGSELDPEPCQAVAKQVSILLDGAFSALLIHRDSSYAEAAGNAAATLIEAAGGRVESTLARTDSA